MLKNTTDVFRKTMMCLCFANGRSIEVSVELSGRIASHKTLQLVVGMTMIFDDFLRQWMLQKVIILLWLNFLYEIEAPRHGSCFEIESTSSNKIRCLSTT